MTLLLMCGGVLAVGYLAVDRLANLIEDTTFDDFEEDDTPIALEYALADVDAVADRVGTINSIEVNDPLTYEIMAENPEYYYDVRGDQGSIIIGVWFDETDDVEEWFDRVAIVESDGAVIEDLSVGKVPFDSHISCQVWESIRGNSELVQEIGEARFVMSEWDESYYEETEQSAGPTFHCVIRGTMGEVKAKAIFVDYDYDTISSLTKIAEDGSETPLSISGQPVEIEN